MEWNGPVASDSLLEAALKILNVPEAALKAVYTDVAVELWNSRQITHVLPVSGSLPTPPAIPARMALHTLHPTQMPKVGKGGTLASRQAILHQLVHIESIAVDLAWDIIARFAADSSYSLPMAFYDDFVMVAADECRHYSLLLKRLKQLGSDHGAFPVHDGLWESAIKTSHSLPARLAVEHCVHEARGLDILPSTIAKFRRNGDEETALLLEQVVYPEEVTHCAAGVRWLTHLHQIAVGSVQEAGPKVESVSRASCSSTDEGQPRLSCSESQPLPDSSGTLPAWMAEARTFGTVQTYFHCLVRSHFQGLLKAPFNTIARAQAGFDEDWYMALTERQQEAVQ